jgi:Spy/CpxP family protein refolding chaperone
MKRFLAVAITGFAFTTAAGYAQEPAPPQPGAAQPDTPPSAQPPSAQPPAEQPPPEQPPVDQPPRTHVDTTVVGSAKAGDSDAPADSASLGDDHHFEAGAPELVSITDRLGLSARQKAQIQEAIERADAGAAALIKRERDVKEMLAATTQEDPLYAQLVAEQSAGGAKWAENRESLRREVLDVLTPSQRARFEQSQPHQ